MAHSIQVYGERTAVINDLDLIVIIGFAVEIIGQRQDFADFQGLAMQWRDSLRLYGPGVIDLKLEQFITTPDGAQKFRSLLSAILEQALIHDETIPAQVLNALPSASGVIFRDYSVSHIAEAVEKLEALIVDK
jgi:hypothetical protein